MVDFYGKCREIYHTWNGMGMATFADGATNTTSETDILIRRFNPLDLLHQIFLRIKLLMNMHFLRTHVMGSLMNVFFFFSETYLLGSQIQRGTFKMH